MPALLLARVSRVKPFFLSARPAEKNEKTWKPACLQLLARKERKHAGRKERNRESQESQKERKKDWKEIEEKILLKFKKVGYMCYNVRSV